ncbi:MAG: hypothetical protein FJ387_10735 [Verrucomicrobia bacterium]|nr:hypothetical protein [Verrucomicrobiota bacterium]
MRHSLLVAALLGASANSGMTPAVAAAEPAPPSSAKLPELLASWHFAGTLALAGDTNAALLRSALATPTSHALIEHTLDKLARAPQRFFSNRLAVATPEPALLLRPLLDDLLRAETYIECRGDPDQPREWILSVQMDRARAEVWRTNWIQLMAAFGAAPTAPLDGDPPNVVEASWASGDTLARFGRAGEWTLCSFGPPGLQSVVAAGKRIRLTGRPVTALGEDWFQLRANLAQLTARLSLPQGVTWPRLALTGAGRSANLRLDGRLAWEKPLTWTLEPWRIPTNTIREPLISFTAAQGLRPWLARQPLVQAAGLNPVPNQLFGWAQSQVPFQTYLAWLLPDPTNALRQLAPRLPDLVKANLPWLEYAKVATPTNTAQVALQGIPIVIPYLEPAGEPDRDFVVAGIFPAVSRKPTAPPELYAQVLGRTNLLYYDWEITQNRVEDWRNLMLYYAMLAGYLPPPTNSASVRWLTDTNTTRYLGNAVTELTVLSPRELALTRTAAIGLTGYELMRLTRWLDDPAFPATSPPRKVFSRREPPAP